MENIFRSLEYTHSSWTSTATASAITLAFVDTAGLKTQDSDCMHLECFMLKSAGLNEAFFVIESNDLCRWNHTSDFWGGAPWPQQWLHIPSHSLQVSGSGLSLYELQILNTAAWFGQGTMQCLIMQQVEEVFRSENVSHCQVATLGSAFAITSAFAAPLDHTASIVQVKVLQNVHVVCQFAFFSIFVQVVSVGLESVSLEIKFCFCDKASSSFGFSASKASFVFAAFNVFDGCCISFSTNCVSNVAKLEIRLVLVTAS